MKRAVKIILTVLVVLVLIVAAGLFALTQLVDPNHFKPQIRAQVLEQTNLDLKMPGNLEWQFWPTLRITLGRTEARIHGRKNLFAAMDSADLSVAVMPLFSGTVKMDGLSMDGLTLNLKKTAEGANWEQVGPQKKAGGEAKAPSGGENKGGMNIPLAIPSVTISNAKVRYQDATRGTDVHLDHIAFKAEHVRLDKPFPVKMFLNYRDQDNRQVKLDVKTTLKADLDAQRYVFDPITAKATVTGVTPDPIDLHLRQKLDLDLGNDRAEVADLVLKAAGTKTTGHLSASDVTHKIKIAGQLDTRPFDANKLLKTIGDEPINTADDKALSKVAVSAKLTGEPGSVMVDPLKVRFDSSALTGRVGLASVDSSKIVFDLNLDRIDLDDYLPAEEKKSAPDKSADSGDRKAELPETTLFPVDALRPLRLDGRLQIGRLGYRGIDASDVALKVNADKGVLKLTQASGKALDGRFDATASVDASGKTPKVRAKGKLSKMQIEPLAKLAAGRDLVQGILDLELDLAARGATQKALVNSAQGTASFTLTNGVIRGVDLYQNLLSGVDETLGSSRALSKLIPELDAGKLSRKVSEHTRIIQLVSQARLDQQVLHLDDLNAKLKKGTVTGKGRLNALTHDFDFHIGMQAPELGGKSKYLQDVTWPLKCSGTLAGSPAKWCRPDKAGFEKIATRVAADAAKRKLEEKLGVESKGDNAKKNLKEKAKKKLEEKFGKKLGDKLEGLFH